jgi:hypothetical protein
MSNQIHDFLQKYKIGKSILAALIIIIALYNIYGYGISIYNIVLLCLGILFILYIQYPKWKFW